MTLVKTVEMRVLSDAGDAQAKLDELDAKAKDLDGSAIKMRFRLDDAEGKAQLDAIKARAHEIGFDDVHVKVRVDGAGRAVAELEALKHEMDSVDRRSIEGGLFSRLLGGAGGGIPDAVGPLPLPALAAAIPLLGALATEAVGVASGFAAAATGAGAFALLALPAIHQVEKALKDTPAQLKKLKLSPDESGAVSGIRQLEAEYKKLSNAFQPQAFKVFNDGLKVVGNLLPHVTPFANTFAQGLDKLLQQASKFTQSKGFSDWLKQFHGLEGPAIASIGRGIGEVANSFGKLMTIMSGKDVGHAINIAFGAISGTINVVTFAIRRFMQNWDGMSAAAAKAGHAVAGAFSAVGAGAVSMQHEVDHVFSEVGSAIAHGVSVAAHAASELPGMLKAVFAGAGSWLVSAGEDIIKGLVRGITSMIGAAVSAAEHVGSAVVGAVKGFLHIGSPSKVMHTIGEQTIQGLIEGIRARSAALKAQMQGTATMIKGEIQQAVQVAQSEISSNSIMNAAATAQGGPLAPVATSDLLSGMQQQVAQVKAFTAAVKQLKAEGLNATSLSQIIGAGSAGGLPTAQALLSGGKGAVAQINALQKQLKASASQLGDAAAGPMYQAGQEAAQGLAKGLRSQLSEVNKAMKELANSMVQAIKTALKSHSPSLVMAEIGKSIPQGVALGIGMASGTAVSASANLAAATVRPWSGTGGRGGGGDVIHINFNGIVGDKYGTAQELHGLLRDFKRNRGNAALGLG